MSINRLEEPHIYIHDDVMIYWYKFSSPVTVQDHDYDYLKDIEGAKDVLMSRKQPKIFNNTEYQFANMVSMYVYHNKWSIVHGFVLIYTINGESADIPRIKYILTRFVYRCCMNMIKFKGEVEDQ